MKRKLTALVLCSILTLSLAAPALAAESTAAATGCEVTVYEKPVSFAAFTVNETVYLRLRDVAQVLSGTGAQFDVDWSADKVVIQTGVPYTSTIGTEMAAPFAGDQDYVVNPNPITVNGQSVDMDAILLTDDARNGYTYCSPESLSRLLGFAITFDSKTGGLIWGDAAPAENGEETPEEPQEQPTEPEQQPTEEQTAEPEEQPAEITEIEQPTEQTQQQPDEAAEKQAAEQTEEVDGVEPILWTGEE